jgi:hypothetical protein
MRSGRSRAGPRRRRVIKRGERREMRTRKKRVGVMGDCAIIELASCVVVADAACWGAAKAKLYSWYGGGG